MLLILWIVWLCLNGFIFLLYGLDRLKAKRGKWRVPERTLLTGTWAMGGVGALMGMKVFHHKTKHLSFRISAIGGTIVSLAVMLALTYVFLPV